MQKLILSFQIILVNALFSALYEEVDQRPDYNLFFILLNK